MLKTCIYCGLQKPQAEFTLEHVWPDALGGDLLPAFQTDDVCGRCNNLAGLFVDGAFLKSWFGQAERSHAAYDSLLDLDVQSKSVMALTYMGLIADTSKATDDIYEMWLGPCGTHVIHARDKNDDEDKWAGYAGGDPIALKKSPGRVYVGLTTTNEQWIALALRSVEAHFPKAARYVSVTSLPPKGDHFAKSVDRNDAQQAHDLKVVEFVRNASQTRKPVRCNPNIPLDERIHTDHRWLAKLALGIGYKLLGPRFLATDYATHLRAAMWERNANERAKLPVRGVGLLHPAANQQLKMLAFPGAWVIYLMAVQSDLALMIITPSGKSLTIAISDTPALWSGEALKQYAEGAFYVVVPAAAIAAGPISAPEYLNHILKNRPHPELAAIEARRIDRASLPPCR